MRHNSNQSEIHPFPEGYPQEGLLEGRNALQEALRSGRTLTRSGLPPETPTGTWPA